ncbi:hypothetical protein CKA32_007072 [Geitlerinema sp. FC II]|nr:hypothetical protein CKA32_007072 [Geitlerinema sp. FC II]
MAVRDERSVSSSTPYFSSHAPLYVGGLHCRCVTISRFQVRHPIFQVTHPCMLGVYTVGA